MLTEYHEAKETRDHVDDVEIAEELFFDPTPEKGLCGGGQLFNETSAEVPYQCTYCEFSCAQADGLQEHETKHTNTKHVAKHTDINSNVCAVCGKTFS